VPGRKQVAQRGFRQTGFGERRNRDVQELAQPVPRPSPRSPRCVPYPFAVYLPRK
jgi:hypothetical protein